MKNLLTVIALLCFSGSPVLSQNIKAVEARVWFMMVLTEEVTRDQALTKFRAMRHSESDSVITMIKVKIDSLLIRYDDPEEHYVSGCDHTTDLCYIKTDIQINRGTIQFIQEARKDIPREK